MFELVLFAFAVLVVVVFWENNVNALLMLLVGWGIAIQIWHTKQDVMLFVVAAVCGPVAEMICIYVGVWQYANPDFLGIPIWLFPLWGFASVFLNRFSHTLLYFYDKWNK